MDRLAQRYADPFSFLAQYLQVGRFHECVTDIIEALNREMEDKQDELLFQIWLHKYEGDQSFNTWKENLRAKPAAIQKAKPKVARPEDMQKNLDVANATLAKLKRSTKGR